MEEPRIADLPPIFAVPEVTPAQRRALIQAVRFYRMDNP
jgi:hypothetical protein